MESQMTIRIKPGLLFHIIIIHSVEVTIAHGYFYPKSQDSPLMTSPELRLTGTPRETEG